MHATAAILLTWAISPTAQSVTLSDSPVGQMVPELVHVEPHVATNPTNADHWLIGTIVTAPDQQSNWRCAALATFDAGTTWRRTDFEIDRCLDPWVIVDKQGRGHFFAVEIQRGYEGDNRFVLKYASSADGGKRWSNLTQLGRTFEHPIAVESSNSIWLTARTTNAAGRRQISLFQFEPKNRHLIPVFDHVPAESSGNVMPTGLHVGHDGAFRITYSATEPEYHIGVIHSDDGGQTVHQPEWHPSACGEGKDTFGGYPFMQGIGHTLFHSCTGPNYEGYWLQVSTDSGLSWRQSPAFFKDDVERHVRTPMIAAQDEQTAAFAWYDRTADPRGHCQDVFFAFTKTAGESVSKPIRISTETSCPNSPANGRAGAQSWNSGGDYSSMTALGDNRFLIIWADSRSDVFQLRFAIANLD